MSCRPSFRLPHCSLRDLPSNPWKDPPIRGAAGSWVPWCRMCCSLVVDLIFLGLNIPVNGSAASSVLLAAVDNINVSKKIWVERSRFFLFWWFCFKNDKKQLNILQHLFCLQHACKKSEARQPLDILRERGKTLPRLTANRLWKVFEQRCFCCSLCRY